MQLHSPLQYGRDLKPESSRTQPPQLQPKQQRLMSKAKDESGIATQKD